MPRAEPPILGVGGRAAAPAPRKGLASAFSEIGSSRRQRGSLSGGGCPCTRWDAAAGLACAVAGCGLVVGLAFVLYPQGFACQSEQRAPFDSGTVAALETLVATAPSCGRATFCVAIAMRTWPASGGAAAAAGSRIVPVAKRSLLERQRAGWVSIVSGESTWSSAREVRKTPFWCPFILL
jgi:hypothetical protein